MPTGRKAHDFTLILTELRWFNGDTADASFDAGCTDATLWHRSGIVGADFSREASTREEAIESAIVALTPINKGVRPVLEEE